MIRHPTSLILMLGGWMFALHLVNQTALAEDADTLDAVLAGFGVPLSTPAVQHSTPHPQPVLAAQPQEIEYWTGDTLGDVNLVDDVNPVCGVGCDGCPPGGCDDNLCGGRWCWQTMPDGLMFQSYLAGPREPRFASIGNYETQGAVSSWDVVLGGRVGVLRYGTPTSHMPQGVQLDIEGAAFPRLEPEEELDVMSTDFRFGVPLTFRNGPWEGKLAFYHLSSHLGDEFLLKNPDYPRINYSRDALVVALAYRPISAVRIYGEAGYGFTARGGSEPIEFQFGVDYSPIEYTHHKHPVPFAAVNVSLRQEVNYGGWIVGQVGYQWRGYSGHLWRIGVQWFNGKSFQGEFYDSYENSLGVAAWYDF